jgi:hypothetical protein
MKKVKVEKEEKNHPFNIIESYSLFKGNMMVRVSGNFYKDIYLSKKKVQAILDNLSELQKFAAGEFDEEIKSLEEGEVLKP